MDGTKRGQAGSLESCDALVTAEIGGGELICEIESPVAQAYGKEMRRQVAATLEELGLPGARVRITDRGAVNFVLCARVEAALRRALEQEPGP